MSKAIEILAENGTNAKDDGKRAADEKVDRSEKIRFIEIESQREKKMRRERKGSEMERMRKEKFGCVIHDIVKFYRW